MPKTANARQSDGTDAALVATLISSNETTDSKQPANMVDGLFAIARAIEGLAVHVKYLGEVLLAGFTVFYSNRKHGGGAGRNLRCVYWEDEWTRTQSTGRRVESRG